jgi:hypothetical protein
LFLVVILVVIPGIIVDRFAAGILMGQDVESERGFFSETTLVGAQVSKVSLLQDLLQDLGTASLRPLFAELALQNSPRYHAASGTTKNDASTKKKRRSWIEVHISLILSSILKQ